MGDKLIFEFKIVCGGLGLIIKHIQPQICSLTRGKSINQGWGQVEEGIASEKRRGG